MAQDIVRVLRLYSFEGPRDAVEKQLTNSLRDGTNDKSQFGPFGHGGIIIKVATLGTFPEILEALSSSPALDLREALAQEQADHDDDIVIPGSPQDPNSFGAR